MKPTPSRKTQDAQPGLLHPVVSRLVKCACGQTPKLVEVPYSTGWPAQYQVECPCGNVMLGDYYSQSEAHLRHAAAKRAAIKEWNNSGGAKSANDKS